MGENISVGVVGRRTWSLFITSRGDSLFPIVNRVFYFIHLSEFSFPLLILISRFRGDGTLFPRWAIERSWWIRYTTHPSNLTSGTTTLYGHNQTLNFSSTAGHNQRCFFIIIIMSSINPMNHFHILFSNRISPVSSHIIYWNLMRTHILLGQVHCWPNTLLHICQHCILSRELKSLWSGHITRLSTPIYESNHSRLLIQVQVWLPALKWNRSRINLAQSMLWWKRFNCDQKIHQVQRVTLIRVGTHISMLILQSLKEVGLLLLLLLP